MTVIAQITNFTDWMSNNPWFAFLLIGGFLLPFLLLATIGRVYPNFPLAILLAVPLAWSFLFIAAMNDSNTMTVAIVGLALIHFSIIAVSLIDLLLIPRLKSVSLERSAMRIASVKQAHTITLTLTNETNKPLAVAVRDDVPPEFMPNPRQFHVRLEPRSRSTLTYEVTPSERGSVVLRTVYVRVRSPLMLWQAFRKYPVRTVLNVYPDMKQLAEYAILARTNRLSLMGVRRTRRIGTDNEFERMRDYTRDDNYKHIDWRTTARRRKLTVKDFQSNQSQRIIFLVDCGRMMTNLSSGLTILDHALNSMLMMSYVALEQGDSVGLICFSDEVHTFVPPRGGKRQMNQLIHASFDRFPKLVESRYDQAFLYLRSHCPKRALIVLITNVIDDVNSNQVEQYLSALVGRHLPLGVLIRDHQIFDIADHPPTQEQGFFGSAAAAEILTWRHQVLSDLEHQGVLTIDTFPEDMTAPLVNRYLEVKARHLL